MRRNRVSACVFAVAASLAGCTGTGEVEYAGEVHVTSPELVMIEPGVQVLADADEPLFYSDGYYWLYRDGYWLRSDSYRGGFARVDFVIVPERIRRIERPQLYVQYRRHMGRNVHARDTNVRTRSPQPQPQPQPYPAPPNQGVPSTPAPDTWQPGQPHHPGNQPGGINPTAPQPTPPVTSPHPMPPGHTGSVGHDHATPPADKLPGHSKIPPGQDPSRIPPGQDPNRIPPGQDPNRVPPGQQDRIAPQPPQQPPRNVQPNPPQQPPRNVQPNPPQQQPPQAQPNRPDPNKPERVPPGQQKPDRQPPQPPAAGAPARPEDRGPQVRPDDRGPAPEQGKVKDAPRGNDDKAKGNDRGNDKGNDKKAGAPAGQRVESDRTDQATPPAPSSEEKARKSDDKAKDAKKKNEKY